MSLLLDSREVIKESDFEVTSLFEVVVSINRLLLCGSRSAICCLRSPVDVEAEVGKASVDGRPRPGKEVRSTLTVRSAMIRTGKLY